MKKKQIKRKSKEVYVITTLRFGYKYSNQKRSADGIYHSFYKRTSPSQKRYFTITRIRTWGWFSDLKTAQECVKENWADIYEGEYDRAVIEKVEEGIINLAGEPKEWWYKWVGSWKKGGYKPWKKPPEYDNIIGFMNRMKNIKTQWSDGIDEGM